VIQITYLKIDIPKIEERYIIYDNGKIFDKKRRKYCTKQTDSKGYQKVWIANIGKNLFVHRLVLCKYVPNENEIYLQANHKNANKNDNRLSNLEWCNQSENQIHAFKNNSQSKLSDKDISKYGNKLDSIYSEIDNDLLNDLKSGLDIEEISSKYHISKRFIRDFKYRKLGIY
jgi:RecA-family ATPase